MCLLHLFVLDSHWATLWESNCPVGFLLVMFPLGSCYFLFVLLSLWCLWWAVWDNCIDSWSVPSLLFLNSPERKDWVGESHGGVIIYVKEGLHYKGRQDLERRGFECIWIELSNNHKCTFFCLFYRPPNSDLAYYSLIEDSFHLAVDSGINNIIITGDLNFNMLHPQSSRKVHTFCTQFALFQAINEPTHFTETSSSLLDILLVSNNSHLIVSGVGDPFLNQEHRYHFQFSVYTISLNPNPNPLFGIYGNMIKVIITYCAIKLHLLTGIPRR